MTRPNESPTAPRDDAALVPEATARWEPRCVQRAGKACRDCVECLSMIPAGKSCGDCAHIRRCLGFGYADEPSRRFCDFIPSRYAPAADAAGRAGR